MPGCGNPSGGWNQESSSGLNWDVLLLPVRTSEVFAAGASSVGPLIQNKPASLQDHLWQFQNTCYWNSESLHHHPECL